MEIALTALRGSSLYDVILQQERYEKSGKKLVFLVRLQVCKARWSTTVHLHDRFTSSTSVDRLAHLCNSMPRRFSGKPESTIGFYSTARLFVTLHAVCRLVLPLCLRRPPYSKASQPFFRCAAGNDCHETASLWWYFWPCWAWRTFCATLLLCGKATFVSSRSIIFTFCAGLLSPLFGNLFLLGASPISFWPRSPWLVKGLSIGP